MAKWRLLERSYINDRVLEADALIGDGAPHPYAGAPGPHLEPQDDEARKLYAAWHEANPAATLDVMSKLSLTEQTPADPIERLAQLLARLLGSPQQLRHAGTK